MTNQMIYYYNNTWKIIWSRK